MSRTMVISPIVSALVKSEDILGKDRTWKAVNDWQEYFLEKFFSKRAELAGFSQKELRNWASFSARELNRILEKEGFDIRLNEFRPEEFGVVSILDVMAEWLKEGLEVAIVSLGKKYPGVRMERDSKFEAYMSLSYSHPIAALPAKSGDKVFMAVADDKAASFSLIEKIDSIRKNLVSGGYYDSLKFPMIDINQEVPLDWLLGLQTLQDDGRQAEISQAFQQTKFKMNQYGARARSAVALGAFKAVIRQEKTLLIDKPFFLWIEREGMSIPVIYAYIDQEDWKNPGNLSEM
jgi:hypothetical protein